MGCGDTGRGAAVRGWFVPRARLGGAGWHLAHAPRIQCANGRRADSEYRHELEADIEPFKGLLLGLFFMSVGMTANLGLLLEQPGLHRVARRRPAGGRSSSLLWVAGAADAALRRERARPGVRSAAGGRVRLRAVLAGRDATA